MITLFTEVEKHKLEIEKLKQKLADAEATLFIYEDPNGKIKQGALNFMTHIASHSSERLIVLEYSEFLKSIHIPNTYTKYNRIRAMLDFPNKELPKFTQFEIDQEDL